ncbi:hypothetical protein FH972_021775 [Carpinus fangiana]|uniref:N-acetylglucosamine-6-phosphate deacetylase n=1 Tax=Carpinus fangiana TaxID=176857 RepID=A0A5N6KSE3_9ROSI|nr:hypothetical protein FH972_021775 [Carpinus fangiana]
MTTLTTFSNCRVCKDGELVDESFVVNSETGLLLKRGTYTGGEIIDLGEAIVAPGFIEIQTNGMLGFHFSNFNNADQYRNDLSKVQRYLPSTGVTSFYPTLSTVPGELYSKILPHLAERDTTPSTSSDGASILGAHVEGPFLQPTRHGAHDPAQFKTPVAPVSAASVYGEGLDAVKLATLAPELPGADSLITDLRRANVRVALGHSSATYDQGIHALRLGATGLTHVFNCMNPLHHRAPGLAGLMTVPDGVNSLNAPFFGFIADGVHLHSAAATMAFRANPQRAILVTDSTELAGVPDGTYSGNPWLPKSQTKIGIRVVIEGTDTLIGSCSTMDECVKNLVNWSGCSLANAVRCATQNPADFMGLSDRGRIEEGLRADFTVLSDSGEILQTWIAGHKVWEKEQ